MLKFDTMEEKETIPVKPRSIAANLFRWLLVLLITGVLAFVSVVVLLVVYENEVKAIVVKELNKHLDAEVKVEPENIDLTILKTFPDCSIEFKNLLMLEALKIKRRDTLLFAEQLNLCFNIKDLWNKTYNIKKIILKRGLLNLKVLKNGDVNYYFWKSEPEISNQGTADSLSFKLESIEARSVNLRYKDKQTQLNTVFFINNITLNGNFHNEDYELNTRGDCNIRQISYVTSNYLRDKDCNFELIFDVKGYDYSLKKARLQINKMALELDGKLRYSDSLESASIRFTAPKLDISSLISLMPREVKSRMNDYKSDGNFYVSGQYTYKKSGDYSLKTDFGIKKGEITYIPNNAKADKVSLLGKLILEPDYSKLELKDLQLKLGNDAIEGNLQLIDFKHPYLKFDAQASVLLEKFMNFYPMDTVRQMSGMLDLKSSFEGLVEDLKANAFSNAVRLTLEANIKELKIQFKNDDKLYAVETCSIIAINREVEVRNCKLIRGSSDVTVSGKIPGLFNYLNDRSQPLIIEGTLRSDNFRLEDFMLKYNSSPDKNAPIIPPNMFFQLDANMNHFSYANFKAEHVRGDFEIKNQKAIASDVKLDVMEGEAEINAYFDNSRKKLDVVLQSQLKHIDITQLFYQFNNFGQSTLVDKNLKGFGTAHIDLSGTWSNALDADYNSIRSTCDLIIEQGELIDFKPMLSLSKFVDVKDLQDIRFSKMQSQVEIHDQTIFFPKTSIKSSALNLEFWGKHDFDNRIDYHIQLLISELLAKRRKNASNDFGELNNDPENRRSAFILMTGTVDNPIIKYDKQGLKEKIRADIKQENQNLKQLLKEEFGLFRKDTLLQRKKTDEAKFELEKPGKPAPKKPLEPKKQKEDEDDF